MCVASLCDLTFVEGVFNERGSGGSGIVVFGEVVMISCKTNLFDVGFPMASCTFRFSFVEVGGICDATFDTFGNGSP